MSKLLWSFDTVIWQQTMTSVDEEYVLDLYYKGVSLNEQKDRIATLGSISKSFVFPVFDDIGVAHYTLPTSITLFSCILSQDQYNLDHLFEKLGNELANMKRRKVCGASRPLSWERLRMYLGTDYPSSVEDLRYLLGDQVICRSRKLFDKIEKQDSLYGLGGVGLGMIYVDGSDLIIPCGPEAGALAPEWDLGWIIGELTELEHSYQRRGRQADHLARYGSTLVSSYQRAGGDVDIGRLSIMSSLRTLLHFFDYSATYPDQFPDEEYCRFLDWLIARACSIGLHEV